MTSRVLRRLAESRSLAPALALAERLDSSGSWILRVLTYHRVDEPEPFARQMEYVARHYHVVSIARVLAAIDGGPRLPPRAVLLSFDDAYRSFAEVAWPILSRHGFRAVLFVPTAYPDGGEERFWWDRLEQAFARTERRTALPTPVGTLPLETAAQRAHAHVLVKRHVKDLQHAETLAATDELCAALGVGRQEHEVLGWEELRALARQGVTLGSHTRTHPRLDRVPRPQACGELLGAVRDLEREIPGQPRVLAYPDGRFDDELVELARGAGVELAFTTRRGTNDLQRSDRMRLRRIHVDSRDSVDVLRAKLVLSAARLEPVTRFLDPPTSAERVVERANRREHRRSQLVLRALDAVLTAKLRPDSRPMERLKRATRPRTAHYERIGQVLRLALDRAPGLVPRVERALLDPSRLPLRARKLELAGFGSGATVFRMESEGVDRPLALKIYRRTLGRAPEHLAISARRYRERYQRLCADFGASVLPAEFLVVHAPLRSVPAVACIQPWLGGKLHDLLGLEDRALLGLLGAHPGLEEQFASFAARALTWRERGTFPDLLGAGNLLVAEEGGQAHLWLIDYGIFEPSDAPASAEARVAIETLACRLESLLERMGSVVRG